MQLGALKFGTFTLKSGRLSPYFFNAGLLCSGPILYTVAQAYALILTTSTDTTTSSFPHFDVLFGPAYKGISFASTTSLVLHTHHNLTVGFAHDRKEAKDHGEGGILVGATIRDKNIIILDDVMTSGKAVRGSIDLVTREGGKMVGVVQMLDREEVGADGTSSTVKEVESIIGEGPGRVQSILRMRDLIQWLEKNGRSQELVAMKEYEEKYGLKT
ncbi:orotate phosphoribosyltransferase [Pluteus cervinus]|uniref:Orotate phosphoribosyltransferase n=1 Tax=Pluteus cervinus TaxID=181527 RepID=A0ACD3A3Q1_9AGAR|nr:orotate phosphoribosyltransferase [Pluteus cervinus]